MKKYKNSKEVDQRNHAIKQLKYRWRIDLTESEYKRICKYIGDAPNKDKYIWDDKTEIELLDKQTNRKYVYRFKYQSKNMIVIWDKSRRQIATFLPKTVKSVNDIEYMKYKELYEGIENFN